MNDVIINQLQFNELRNLPDFQKTGSVLTSDNRDELMQKTRSFLANRSRLIITNRKQVNAQKDGCFILEISQKGYRLIRSQSVRRSEYTYSFKHNVFKKTSAQLKRELKFSKNCRESGFQERKKSK